MLDPHVLTFKTPNASLNQSDVSNQSAIDMPADSFEPNTSQAKHTFGDIFKEVDRTRLEKSEGEMSEVPLESIISYRDGDNMIVIDDNLLTANDPVAFITPPLSAEASVLVMQNSVERLDEGLIEGEASPDLLVTSDQASLLTPVPLVNPFKPMPVTPPLKPLEGIENASIKSMMIPNPNGEKTLSSKQMKTTIVEEGDLLLTNSLLKTPVANPIQAEKSVLAAGLSKLQSSEFLQAINQNVAEPFVEGSDIDAEILKQLGLIGTNTHLNQVVNTEAAKASLTITVPFQQAQWGAAVAEKVMWMSSHGLQEAEIQMDPPELGPLQVKVSIENDQAHVSFVVQHANVKDALEQTAMRLRDMFDAEGIDLVDVDVSDQSADEDESTFAEEQLAEDALEAETALNNTQSQTISSIIDSNGVDAYV